MEFWKFVSIEWRPFSSVRSYLTAVANPRRDAAGLTLPMLLYWDSQRSSLLHLLRVNNHAGFSEPPLPSASRGCCALGLTKHYMFNFAVSFLLTFAMSGVRGEVRKYFLYNKTSTLKEVFDGNLRVCPLVPSIYWLTKCFTSLKECKQGNKSISSLYGLGA